MRGLMDELRSESTWTSACTRTPRPHRSVERRVDIGRQAVGVAMRRTVFAVDRRRGKIRGPIQGKQPRVADRAVGIDHTSLRQGIEEIRRTSAPMRWRGWRRAGRWPSPAVLFSSGSPVPGEPIRLADFVQRLGLADRFQGDLRFEAGTVNLTRLGVAHDVDPHVHRFSLA